MTKKSMYLVAKRKRKKVVSIERQSADLDPNLKAWIDDVIVPILVRLYQEARSEERVA